MKISTIPSAQLLVQNLAAYGIQHIVISPGSRSAPLTLSLTALPQFECHSVVDERSAAFFALGIAQQLQKPVALVCTSGSAVLNYLPAVAEAFYSGIPLLILSADRPTYRIDIGDGQTIRQEQIMTSFSCYSGALLQDVTHASHNILLSNQQQLITSDTDLQKQQVEQNSRNQEILHVAFRKLLEQQLPVHLNIPFEEPLYKLEAFRSQDIEAQSIGQKSSDPKLRKQLLDNYQSSTKTLILVGVLYPQEQLRQLLASLAQKDTVLIFAESLSNIKQVGVIENIDICIAPLELKDNAAALFEELQPDLLITIGGLVVSKKVKTFLRKNPPSRHFHLGNTPAYDTYFQGVSHIQGDLLDLLSLLDHQPIHTSTYRKIGQQHISNHLQRHQTYVQKVPYSDFYAFEKLWKAIPQYYQIHLSNSSAVRYAQLFDSRALGDMYCNRGTSGIDGSISTAVGASVATKQPTLCISGDLSFFYDSNALWKNKIPSNFRIIIVNNNGGGIFRILPDTIKDDLFETYFETQHGITAKQLARMYGVKYLSARNSWQLKWQLSRFFRPSKGPKILEIFTPTHKNPDVLSSYFKYLAQQ